MIKTIFFDVDGVLCDFVGGVKALLNLPPEFKPTQWRFYKDIGLTVNEFYAAIRAENNFWENLNICADGMYLWRHCKLLQKKTDFNLALITSPAAHDDEFCRQRVAWILHHLNTAPWIITENKHLVAGPGKLLIDDYPENIEAWREAGGEAILMPRTWNGQADENHLGDLKTMEILGKIDSFLGIQT